jgi:hypothetical protein
MPSSRFPGDVVAENEKGTAAIHVAAWTIPAVPLSWGPVAR